MSDKIYISELPTLMKDLDWDKNNKKGLTPNSLSSGSSKKAWWKCPLGHEWKASIYERATRNTGCSYCANRKIYIGFNDLPTTNPDLAKEWHPIKNGKLTPYEVIGVSPKKVWWLCKNGHEWQANIESRASGRGCPFCANNKILEGFNDLETTHPLLVEEWNFEKNGSLYPNAILAGSGKKVWWKCKSGHEWQATVSHRAIRGQAVLFVADDKQFWEKLI